VSRACLSASPAILVCCDLQEDCRPADERSTLAAAACVELLARWRGLRWPVAHLKRVGERQWITGAPEWINAFRPRPDELAFTHHLPSAYSSAHFEQYMQSIRSSACVLIGYSLDETILATAVDGYHRNHRYYVANDAVACKFAPPADVDAYRRAVIAVVQKFSGTFRTAEALPPLLKGGGPDRPRSPWESMSP
jgi:nicotinamidase-related amidase